MRLKKPNSQFSAGLGPTMATWVALAALLALVASVYLPGLNGGFIFDDYPNIVFNTTLHVRTLLWPDWMAAAFSSQSSELQRPLAMLSFAAQHYFFGLDSRAFKIGNLVVHMTNTLLVFGLARSILRAAFRNDHSERPLTRWALAIAALWALAPINFMAVLFVVQRMESLCHTFVFAGLWIYCAARSSHAAGKGGLASAMGGLLAATLLGALSKESAVLLPLYAFCIELTLFRFRSGHDETDRRLIWFFALVLFLPAILGIAWLLPKAMRPSAYAARDFDMYSRLLTEPRVLCEYLRWSILPDLGRMGLYHDDIAPSTGFFSPATTALSFLALTALALIALLTRQPRPLLSLGIFWFLSAHLLTATFLPLELVFEHRNYFASLGVALALTDVLAILPASDSRRRIGHVSLALLISWHAGTTYLRSREWRDPLTFALTEASKHPLSPRATYQLGQTYAMLFELNQNPAYKRAAIDALETARTVPRAGILPAQGLLMLAAGAKEAMKDEWWQEIEMRLQLRRAGPQETGALAAMTSCATALRCEFPRDRMLRLFAAGFRKGQNAELLNITADYVLNIMQDPETAERLWRECIQLSPQNIQYRINLTKLLIARGKREEAISLIDAIPRQGRYGQHANAAAELRRLLESARQSGGP